MVTKKIKRPKTIARSSKIPVAVRQLLTPPVPEAPALLKLNLGAGKSRIEGYLSVDSIPFDGLDIVTDLRKPWPWGDSTVSNIHMSHVLEHFTGDERVHIMNEMYRVLAPGGQSYIIVPHWCSQRAYGDFTHCFAKGTEILTERGWASIDSVKIGDRVLALDIETEKTSIVSVVGTINLPYVGEMMHFETECMDMLVTPNHDMVWRSKGNGSSYKTPPLKKSSAAEFHSMGGHHPRRAVGIIDWEGHSPSTITISDDEVVNGHHIQGSFDAGDFCELLGWYLSEGSTDLTSSGHYRVQIAQSEKANPGKYWKIVELIRRLGFSPTLHADRIRFSSKSLAKYLSALGKSDRKFIPETVKKLSSALLRRLIFSAVEGDGRKNGTGWEYATTSGQLAADMHEIALKAGFRSQTRIEKRSEIHYSHVINGHTVSVHQDLHLISICQPKHVWYPIPSRVNYSGHIVCVTLAEKNNIYVRRNGKGLWSGNCWPPVSEMFFNYLWREWRLANAPHNDIQYNPKGYNCDFSFGGGYGVHEEVLKWNDERSQYAQKWFRDACADIHMTITSLKKPPE